MNEMRVNDSQISMTRNNEACMVITEDISPEIAYTGEYRLWKKTTVKDKWVFILLRKERLTDQSQMSMSYNVGEEMA